MHFLAAKLKRSLVLRAVPANDCDIEVGPENPSDQISNIAGVLQFALMSSVQQFDRSFILFSIIADLHESDD